MPSDPRDLHARCFEAYNIQVHGLTKRLTSTGIEKVVIGVSGGLDSKVGSGGSLSPRGDWRAPSDSEAVVWLDELRHNMPVA